MIYYGAKSITRVSKDGVIEQRASIWVAHKATPERGWKNSFDITWDSFKSQKIFYSSIAKSKAQRELAEEWGKKCDYERQANK